MFVAFKLTKNDDFDKCRYSGNGIGFDEQESFSLSDGSRIVKDVIVFGVDMSISVHVNNRKKDILITVKGPTHSLDDTTLKNML